MKAKPSRDLKIIFVQPQGGCDQKRLSMALRMLISEKDVIDYFIDRSRHQTNPQPATPQPKRCSESPELGK